MAFDAAGHECVFSSEWDKYAQKTYEANFGDRPAGDITEIQSHEIPDFDILLGGFPCQPFSIAGVSKKNALGRSHGFLDKTQGTLFFDVARIIRDKRPRAFVLENVKNLRSHDRGKTMEVILATLTKELGYHVQFRVINAITYVPQNRERIFIVGFRDKKSAESFSFPEEFPEFSNESGKVKRKGTSLKIVPKMKDILEKNVDLKYHLTDKLWNYLQDYKEKHRQAGNGFGFGLVDPEGSARTLSARYYKDGSEILVPVGDGKNPRRLTPRECARLMGYPDDFKIVVSDTQAYKQFGNSVVVPVVRQIAKVMTRALVATDEIKLKDVVRVGEKENNKTGKGRQKARKKDTA